MKQHNIYVKQSDLESLLLRHTTSVNGLAIELNSKEGHGYHTKGMMTLMSTFRLFIHKDNKIHLVTFNMKNSERPFDMLYDSKFNISNLNFKKGNNNVSFVKLSKRDLVKLAQDKINTFFKDEFNIDLMDWYKAPAFTELNNFVSDFELNNGSVMDAAYINICYFIREDNMCLLNTMLSNRPDVVDSKLKSFITKDSKYMVETIDINDVTEHHNPTVNNYLNGLKGGTNVY